MRGDAWYRTGASGRWDSFRLTGSLRCSGTTVTLPRIGTVRTHEPTRKLARRLENGTGRILSATVSRTAHAGMCVDNDGNVFTVTGPKPLNAALRKLRRAGRAHSRKANGSVSRRESAARLAGIHARVASIRADALHKATSGLAARYETVVIEDLNVAGMTRNRRLVRAIADRGFRRGSQDAGL